MNPHFIYVPLLALVVGAAITSIVMIHDRRNTCHAKMQAFREEVDENNREAEARYNELKSVNDAYLEKETTMKARGQTPQPTMAIAVSTFMRETTCRDRIPYFQKCIISLLVSEFPGTIYIVDDGSEVQDHLEWARTLEDKRIRIVQKPQNSGIAKTKNTSIRLCLENPEVTYFFLSDDDMVFKTPHWYKIYTNATHYTGIDHFCFAVPDESGKDKIPRNIQGYDVIQTPFVNGCLLAATRDIVDKIGYFKILPHKYGHEHGNYSSRAYKFTDGFFDACDSSKHIGLIDGSNEVHSIDFTTDEFEANLKEAMDITELYQPCVE